MTDHPVSLADVLAMLLTSNARPTSDAAAAALGVDGQEVRAALSILEQARLLEGTKKNTAREQWFSNVANGTLAELLEEIARLEEAGRLPPGFEQRNVPFA